MQPPDIFPSLSLEADDEKFLENVNARLLIISIFLQLQI